MYFNILYITILQDISGYFRKNLHLVHLISRVVNFSQNLDENILFIEFLANFFEEKSKINFVYE